MKTRIIYINIKKRAMKKKGEKNTYICIQLSLRALRTKNEQYERSNAKSRLWRKGGLK